MENQPSAFIPLILLASWTIPFIFLCRQLAKDSGWVTDRSTLILLFIVVSNVMQKIFAVISIVAILVACTTPKAETSSQPSDQTTPQLYRDSKLAQYLVGTWYQDEKEDSVIISDEVTFEADGTVSSELSYSPVSDVVSNTNVPNSITYSGAWRIDGDIVIETVEKMSVFLKPLPKTGKFRITVIGPDERTSQSLETGKIVTYHRKPTITEQHQQLFHQTWPAPSSTDTWVEFHKDPITTSYFDKSTIQRYGYIVKVWIRADMSEAAIDNARKQHKQLKDRDSTVTGIIMEQGFIYHLLDCRRRLTKPREIRIHERGQLVASSDYGDEDPEYWTRITKFDDNMIALMEKICGENN